MSATNSTRELAPGQKQYFTSYSGAPIARVSHHTVLKYVTPDAWMWSGDGTKRFPLYLRETLEAYASRAAQNLQAAPAARDER